SPGGGDPGPGSGPPPAGRGGPGGGPGGPPPLLRRPVHRTDRGGPGRFARNRLERSERMSGRAGKPGVFIIRANVLSHQRGRLIRRTKVGRGEPYQASARILRNQSRSWASTDRVQANDRRAGDELRAFGRNGGNLALLRLPFIVSERSYRQWAYAR